MKKYYYVIVDVGCIECGEQTTLRFVTESEKEAETEINKICKKLELEDREPCGIMELLCKAKKDDSFLYGTGYFTGGQHSLQLHRIPKPGKGVTHEKTGL